MKSRKKPEGPVTYPKHEQVEGRRAPNQWMAIPRLACALNAAPLVRASRVAALSVTGLYAASHARGRMSHSVERVG